MKTFIRLTKKLPIEELNKLAEMVLAIIDEVTNG